MFQKPKSLLSCSLNQRMCVKYFVFGLRAITTSFIILLTLCLIFKMVDEQFLFFLRKVTSQLISLISTLINSRELNGKGKKTHFINTELLLASLHKNVTSTNIVTSPENFLTFSFTFCYTDVKFQVCI